MMYKKKIPIRTECGLHVFKELLNGKWKLMMIYYISDGIKRPSTLQKKIGVDRRVMAKQVDELVKYGFVDKISFDTKIPKVEYHLTSLGFSLLPLIISLEKWGEENRAVLEKVTNENSSKIENLSITSCSPSGTGLPATPWTDTTSLTN